MIVKATSAIEIAVQVYTRRRAGTIPKSSKQVKKSKKSKCSKGLQPWYKTAS